MECRILGPLECLDCGVALPVGAPRHQKVLARLVIGAGRVVPLWSLVAAVWDRDPPASSARLIRNAVSDLRVAWMAMATVDPSRVIVTEGDGYLLRLGPGSLDAQRFDRGLAGAATAYGQGDLPAAARLLRSALALWRGSAFAGLAGPVFAAAAARWEERRLLAWQRLVAAELALGGHHELLGELTALAAEHPYHEAFAGQLMVALYRCGRQADALSVYARLRRCLVEDLAIEPGEELARLHLAILRREATATGWDGNGMAQGSARSALGPRATTALAVQKGGST